MRPSEKVVGSKMPQYRLFGDTVDVAGMMTITGEGQPRIIRTKLFKTAFQRVTN